MLLSTVTYLQDPSRNLRSVLWRCYELYSWRKCADVFTCCWLGVLGLWVLNLVLSS